MSESLLKWSDLTDKEREFWVKEMANGCGSSGPLAKLVPELKFHLACNIHDFLYWRGGGEEAKNEANAEFIYHMLLAIKGLPWWKRLYYQGWAFFYYQNVDFFSGFFFPDYPAKTSEDFHQLMREKGYDVLIPEHPPHEC